MKINLIVILSIIFYTTTLLGSGKEQVVKKVVSYTKEQKAPSKEYIPVSYTHLTLPTILRV